MQKTILLTGATGALGTMLLPRLLDKGYRVVCLVRSMPGEHPSKRLPGYDPRQVIAIHGDITADQCGVSAADLELWKHRITFMLHCAASISFTDGDATSAANIDGVSNALELAERLGIPTFRHVSTSYIAGDSEWFSEQDLLTSQRWRNPYESTKYVGETQVRAWGLNHPDRKYDIYRPSILIGCEDGTTPTFDAYFGYFRPIDTVARSLRARTKGLPEGVYITPDGYIHLPIVLMASATSTLNLIPIDWVADMMVAMVTLPPGNKTYHLVHPEPPLVRDVIKWSLSALRVTGVTVVDNVEEKNTFIAAQPPLVRKLQHTIDKTLDQYMPYTNHGTKFESVVTQFSLGKRYRAPITVGEQFLGTLLSYAAASGWAAPSAVLEPAE